MCQNCEQSYDHDPVTADGPVIGVPRKHFMACSWDCLIEEILKAVNPA